ncbi:hypothetical protein ACFQGE_13195 [Halomicroarcula sp. GCM10025817]|uniref:hypothetical protein n=1 Tax=Haloarcula TaxID=2237 RepID=UPI0023E82E15|nr:hypothetical protein [Halomicroarcula sp. SYNS111]
MSKIKTGLLAVTGAAIGIVTLRKLRKRRSEETIEDESGPEEGTDAAVDSAEASEDIDEAAEDVVEAKGEAVTAAKHVAGAVKHTGLAVVKTIQQRRQATDPVATGPETVTLEENPE